MSLPEERRPLCVGPEARWIEVDGRRIKLERRRAPRRILARLCELAQCEPGETLTVEPLFEAGWPGESIRYESRVKRVHTAIWTLRKMGLGDALRTIDKGYCIDPSVQMV
jgi:hypothetical protein